MAGLNSADKLAGFVGQSMGGPKVAAPSANYGKILANTGFTGAGTWVLSADGVVWVFAIGGGMAGGNGGPGGGGFGGNAAARRWGWFRAGSVFTFSTGAGGVHDYGAGGDTVVTGPDGWVMTACGGGSTLSSGNTIAGYNADYYARGGSGGVAGQNGASGGSSGAGGASGGGGAGGFSNMNFITAQNLSPGAGGSAGSGSGVVGSGGNQYGGAGGGALSASGGDGARGGVGYTLVGTT